MSQQREIEAKSYQVTWKKGQSGNPSGKPPAMPAELRDIARSHTRDALRVLHEVMSDPTQPAPARVSAANSLLDRGWGKPAPAATDPDGNSPKLLIEIVRFADGGGA